MQNTKILAQKEMVIRILRKRYKNKREDLHEFYKSYMLEEKKKFIDSWYYKIICEVLVVL